MRKTQSSGGNVFRRKILGLEILRDFLSFHLKKYTFVYILSPCKYVHHELVLCPESTEEGVGYLGNEDTNQVMSCQVGAWD